MARSATFARGPSAQRATPGGGAGTSFNLLNQRTTATALAWQSAGRDDRPVAARCEVADDGTERATNRGGQRPAVALGNGASMCDVDDGDLGGGKDAARQLLPVDLGAPLVGAIADLGSVVAMTEQTVEQPKREGVVVAM